MAKKSKSNAAFVQWFRPLIHALRELGGSGTPREICARIAKNENVSDDTQEEVMSSGTLRFNNQVAWARQYLVWEGFIDASQRGIWSLTPEGYKVNLNEIKGGEIFVKWVKINQANKIAKNKEEIIDEIDKDSPDEVDINSSGSLLEVLQGLSPEGFERICQRLLRESGFENVEVTGKSHDGGLDGYGTLKISPFVSFKVLFQCKRYQGTVSRAQVGDFRNAMIGRAEKGIILTTGTFSRDAQAEASRDGAPPIELVDGSKLIDLFEKFELGLKPKTIYEIDYHFFESYR